MKKRIYIIIATVILGNTLVLAQNMRLTLNNNVYLVLDNNANLVIDNSNTNAITVLGSGANIKSESETNLVKWNIKNATGTYTLPFTTKNNVKIPMALSITSAGSNDGYITFSTHTDNDATNSWNNSDYKPSGVTNMYGVNGQTNNSANVIDRFWTIDQQGYATNPTGTITLAYDENERTATGNSIAAGTLVGQYWNESNNRWFYETLTGTDNHPTYTVSGIQTGANFYKNWTLSSSANPLPITLVEFKGRNKGTYNALEWKTETEIDNDYFTLERSIDATNWHEIAEIDGAGNSLEPKNYSFNDYRIVGNSLYYYRLKQTDFNGGFSYSNLVVIKTSAINDLTVFPNPSNGVFYIASNKVIQNIVVFDVSGKKVVDITRNFNQIDLSNLNKGVYFLNIRLEKGDNIVERIVLN